MISLTSKKNEHYSYLLFFCYCILCKSLISCNGQEEQEAIHHVANLRGNGPASVVYKTDDASLDQEFIKNTPLQKFIELNGNEQQNLTIYVYSPPSHLNIDLDLEKEGNLEYFKLESRLLEGLRERGRVVANPEEANAFWVPHSMVANWIAEPPAVSNLPSYYTNHLRPFLQHIQQDLPYFNASQGSDHFFVYEMDVGPFCEKDHGAEVFLEDDVWQNVVSRMNIIGYWGQYNLLAKPELPSSSNRKYCFEPGRDIAVPQWHSFEPTYSTTSDMIQNLSDAARKTRNALFYKGQNKKGHYCSHGIRLWLNWFCNSSHGDCNKYSMAHGVFSLCPAGWACWSSRMYDAISSNSIPVILADDMVLPFSDFIDWNEFSITIATGRNPPEDDNSLLFHEFSELQKSARSWKDICRKKPFSIKKKISKMCKEHHITQKKIALSKIWRKFAWNTEDPDSAFGMVEKEMMQRVFALRSQK